MRLGTHAVRTAAVPLPFSGVIGTPTVSRLIVEHVLQCFGFPKTTPAEVEDVMRRIVSKNKADYLKIGLTQTAAVGIVTLAAAIPTSGIGAIAGIAGCFLAVPPAARMLLKCSCDMILILERAFRYEGKYVSVKEIEDAAKYYTTTMVKTFTGTEKGLQQLVHDEIDRLLPLKKVTVGFNFKKLRGAVEEIIYSCRFDQMSQPDADGVSELSGTPVHLAELAGSEVDSRHELDAGPVPTPELPRDTVSKETPGPEGFMSKLTLLDSKSTSTPSIVDGPKLQHLSEQRKWGHGTTMPLQTPILAELDTTSSLSSRSVAELDGGSVDAPHKEKAESGRTWRPSSWKFGKKAKSTSK